jgi:mannose-6-phosphate isomerase-like protein (cupin superfamily)
MHTFHGSDDDVTVSSVRDLGVARAKRRSLHDAIPFGTRRYTVPPGASGSALRHHGLELSRVVAGRALVEVAGAIADIDEGEAVLFESGETHVFHNRSTSEPLVIFTTCWVPRAADAVPLSIEAITA